MPRLRFLLAAALGCMALAPACARAGTYTVYMCAGPTGAPLPAGGVALLPSQTGALATNTCGTAGGALSAALTGDKWDGSQGASVRFSTPAGTSITGVTMNRTTQGLTTPSTGGGLFFYRLRTDSATLESCASCASDFSGSFTQSGLSAAFVEIGVVCLAAEPDTCQTADATNDPRLDVHQAIFTVADDAPPVLSNVRGALFSGGPAKGIVTVQFNATDVGGGLYRAFTLVDDKVVSTQPLDQHCTDVDPSDSDPYEFSSLAPCLTSLTDFTVPIDTTKLGEGVHTFAVRVEDAAGNQVTVAGPKSIRVENLNGINASRNARLKMWFVKTRKRTASSVRGERVVVRGRLIGANGKGVSGAIVDVYHYVGHHRLSKTGLKSRRGGRLTLILPKNVFGDRKGHRTLLFVYRVRRPGPATSKQRLLLSIHYPSGKPLYRPIR